MNLFDLLIYSNTVVLLTFQRKQHVSDMDATPWKNHFQFYFDSFVCVSYCVQLICSAESCNNCNENNNGFASLRHVDMYELYGMRMIHFLEN